MGAATESCRSYQGLAIAGDCHSHGMGIQPCKAGRMLPKLDNCPGNRLKKGNALCQYKIVMSNITCKKFANKDFGNCYEYLPYFVIIQDINTIAMVIVLQMSCHKKCSFFLCTPKETYAMAVKLYLNSGNIILKPLYQTTNVFFCRTGISH